MEKEDLTLVLDGNVNFLSHLLLVSLVQLPVTTEREKERSIRDHNLLTFAYTDHTLR